MSRRRHFAARETQIVDLEAVLSGRKKTTPDAVISMIHRVNPTGRGLGRERAEQQYRRKHQLQSLLIEHFGNDLQVVQDDMDPETVLIRHPLLGKDACHAQIAKLHPEAQSIVRFQLDLAEAEELSLTDPSVSIERSEKEPPPEAETSPMISTQGLIDLGKTLLDQYDYDGARRCFEEAFSKDPRHPQTGPALLEMLVDRLAAYSEALTVAETLVEARSLGARAAFFAAHAAAHLGRFADARRFAASLPFESTGPIYLIMATQSISSASMSETKILLEEAEARQAAPLDLAAVQKKLEEHVEKLRTPKEAQLAAAMQNGRTDLARALAKRLLADFGDSKAARDALKIIRKQELDNALADALNRVHSAEQQQNWEAAEKALLEAAAKGGDPRETARRLKIITAIKTEATVRRVIEALDISLQEGDTEDALLRYLAFDTEMRRQVQARSPSTRWKQLDILVPFATKKTKMREAVKSLLALEEAIRAASTGDFHTVSSLLPNLQATVQLPEHTQLQSMIAAHETTLLRETAAQRLDDAKKCLKEGRLKQAEDALNSIIPEHLDDVQKYTRESLRAAIVDEQEVRFLMDEIARGTKSDDPVRVRNAKLNLAVRAESRREMLLEQAQKSDVRAKLKYRLNRVSASSKMNAPKLECHEKHLYETHAVRFGEQVIAAVAHGHRIFFKAVDIASQRVLTQSLLTLEGDEHYLKSIFMDDGILFVEISNGDLYEMDYAKWCILDIHRLREYVPPHHSYQRSIVFPGSRRVWLASRCGMGIGNIRIIDLKTRQTLRILGEGDCNMLLLKGEKPALILNKNDEYGALSQRRNRHCGMYSADGTPADTFDFPMYKIAAAAPYTAKATTVLAVQGTQSHDCLHLVAMGSALEPYSLPGSSKYRGIRLGERSDLDLFFALIDKLDHTKQLFALRLYPSGFEEIWQVRLPVSATICTDPAGDHPVLLHRDNQGIHTIQLGSKPPRVPKFRANPKERIPLFMDWFWNCSWPGEEIQDKSYKIAKQIRRTKADRQQLLVDTMFEESSLSIIGLTALGLGILDSGYSGYATFREKAEQIHPHRIDLGLVHAQEALKRCAWHEMKEILVQLTLKNASKSAAAHRLHLLGMAEFALGNVDKARSDWEWSTSPKGSACDTSDLLPLTDPLPSPLKEKHWNARRPLMVQIKGAIAAADAALGKDDLDGAIFALDRPVVRNTAEVQSIARLTAAYLRKEIPEDPYDAVRQAELFALFLDITRHPVDGTFPNQLMMPRGLWPLEKVMGLRPQVEAQLDRLYEKWNENPLSLEIL